MDPPTKKSRKPNWTEEQNLLLTRLVEQNKAVILGKFGPGVTAQKKTERWGDICAEINTTFASGGPSCLALSAVNEVVRDILGSDNMVIDGVPTATDSSMLQVLEMPSMEESRSDTMTELDLRTLQALSGIQVLPSKPTLSKLTVHTPASTATSSSQLCHNCQLSGSEQETLKIEKLKLEIEILKLRKFMFLKEMKKAVEE